MMYYAGVYNHTRMLLSATVATKLIRTCFLIDIGDVILVVRRLVKTIHALRN